MDAYCPALLDLGERLPTDGYTDADLLVEIAFREAAAQAPASFLRLAVWSADREDLVDDLHARIKGGL
jgi:hypothetical protein